MADESLPTQVAAPSGGVRLYSPGVLVAYFILGNIPIGMALYGLNVARRGDRWAGYVLFGVSALALVMLILASAAGRSMRGWSLLALLIGISVFRIEGPAYRRAIKDGAAPAAWWPPIIAVVALLIVVIMISPAA